MPTEFFFTSFSLLPKLQGVIQRERFPGFFFHQNRVHNLVLSLCNYWKGVIVLPSNNSLHTQMRPLRISLLLPLFFFFFSSTDHYKLEYKWYLIGVLLKLIALLAESIYILSDYYSIYR